MDNQIETALGAGVRSARWPIVLGGLLLAAVAIVAWIQHSESQAIRAELKAVTERLAE